ncbi:MAG: beta galactosidase jelly roll domain-containing protein [Solirubrobacteraceae bacterium]
MVRDDSHNEDGGINDAQKEGRGLISVVMADATGTATTTPISWKIQGDQGGEDITDTVRGPINNGGLYGERAGWYLPGYPDANWPAASVPASSATAGTTWHRTQFGLHIPSVGDASLGLTIGDPSVPRSAANYRALIFVNGWNMGQYIANVGPQHTFVLPNGVLNPHGENSALQATIDFGDGTTSGAAVTGTGPQRLVTATHLYRQPGDYRARVMIGDVYGGARLTQGAVTVSVARSRH